MSVDVWLARTFSILVASIALAVACGAGAVFRLYYQQFQEELKAWCQLEPEKKVCLQGGKPTFNTHAVIIVTVAVALECILWAVLDVGEAFNLVVDGWGAIVGIVGTLILPMLGYKSVQTIAAGKNQPTNVTGGGQ